MRIRYVLLLLAAEVKCPTMPIITLDTLRETRGPLMGLDPGTKTLGLAISDRTRLIASPFHTIHRKKFTPDAQSLLKTYHENEAAALIVGHPINMDGSHGPRTQSVRDFCTNLMRLDDLPIFLWDERLKACWTGCEVKLSFDSHGLGDYHRENLERTLCRLL